jgi:hypothetical protein
LVYLVVSEASVHGGLAPLLWACGEAEKHGGRGGCALHGAQEEAEGREGDPAFSSKALWATSESCTTSQWSHRLVTKPLSHGT